MLQALRRTWLSNPRGDLLAGAVVALALIPEAIAFSIIAGVDPKIGLYASFSMAVVIAFAGGRPAMISAATGAMALLMVDLVKDHGLEYLLAATVLCGLIQIVFGILRLGQLMRFVSKSVVTGFVNALAILIFMAQLPELTNVSWLVYVMTAAGLGIIYLYPYIPRVGTALPSPLVCIIVLTTLSVLLGLEVRTVGDMGELPDALPFFHLADVPLTVETLKIIFPYSLGLAVVGLLESMMTETIVDELTGTDSDRHRECRGQGIANVVTGLFGGMAGCAMIGQSVINVKSGGRGRLSTLFAGILLLILVVFLDALVARIPMAALVAIMIMVSIGTFNWSSVRDIRKLPLSSSIVMVSTVAVVVFTHNLAIGVGVGVLLSALFFANKVGQILYVGAKTDAEAHHVRYEVVGQVFFASAERFKASFDFGEINDRITIDVSRAHFWDISAVAALDEVIIKFRREGAEVEVVGLDAASATMVDRFAVHDKPGAVEALMGH